MQTPDETLAERAASYGQFLNNATVADELLKVMRGQAYMIDNNGQRIGTMYESMPPDQRIALQHIAAKLGRLLTGDFNHVDSWHDIAGYATLITDRLTSRGTYATHTATPAAVEEPVSQQSGDVAPWPDISSAP